LLGEGFFFFFAAFFFAGSFFVGIFNVTSDPCFLFTNYCSPLLGKLVKLFLSHVTKKFKAKIRSATEIC